MIDKWAFDNSNAPVKTVEKKPEPRVENLTQMAKRFRKQSSAKGFNNFPSSMEMATMLPRAHMQLAAMTALIAGEAHEAIQELRADNFVAYWQEIADVIIRALDLCGEYEIDIQKIVDEKQAYNAGRPHKHGKVF